MSAAGSAARLSSTRSGGITAACSSARLVIPVSTKIAPSPVANAVVVGCLDLAGLAVLQAVYPRTL
jgi:hypothetical protein